MLTGNARTMTDLIEAVQREAVLKRDFVPVPASKMVAASMQGNRAQLMVELNAGSPEAVSFDLNPVAHENLSTLCGIDMRYYRKLLSIESKELWAANVNKWLPEVTDRTVRTFDPDFTADSPSTGSGVIRCLKSDHYRCLDNADLLAALLPQFEKREMHVLTCNLSEKQMVIKAVSPTMLADVPRLGDSVQAGIAVGNSEVGTGALWMTTYDYILSCTNGMVGVKANKWVHRSGKAGDEDTQFGNYTTDTQRKTNEAFWAQVTDDIDRIFDEELFAVRLSNYGDAADDEIERVNERPVIETVCSDYGIPKEDVENVLRYYHTGGQENRWGVAQAVTRYAQDVSDFDVATKLEEAGSNIITKALPV
jgi:hypothetical protein